MSRSRRGRLLVVALVWLAVAGAAAVAYRLIFAPDPEKTGSEQSGLRELHLALDAFSGYGVFRSPEFADELELEGLDLVLDDDGADYGARIRRLEKGEVQLAVFTIDALVKTSAEVDALPGTIVMVIDESRGADALVAHKAVIPNLDALNRANARVVGTSDSPSETLYRVVRDAFYLPDLPSDCWIGVSGPDEALRQLQSDRTSPRAYALWEPFVTAALQDPGVVRLADSARFNEFIVDVLVAERSFLEQSGGDVAAVVRAYQRAYYEIRGRANGMIDLLRADARRTGDRLTDAQVASLAAGIRWKNTRENYAHMGILPPAEAQGLGHLERIIKKITRLLVKTGAIRDDPTEGKAHLLYYDRIFRDLHDGGFHPSASGFSDREEEVAARPALPALTADQWEELDPVGTAQVERIAFPRGRDHLNAQAELALKQLAAKLVDDYPRYYLLIRGHAAAVGDPDANRRLAEQRARRVRDFLQSLGVETQRLRAVGLEPRAGSDQTVVSFLLSEMPVLVPKPACLNVTNV